MASDNDAVQDRIWLITKLIIIAIWVTLGYIIWHSAQTEVDSCYLQEGASWIRTC